VDTVDNYVYGQLASFVPGTEIFAPVGQWPGSAPVDYFETVDFADFALL
jgi:hypothetical protein